MCILGHIRSSHLTHPSIPHASGTPRRVRVYTHEHMKSPNKSLLRVCLCRVRRGRAQSTPQLRKRSPRCFSLHCSHPDSFPAYLLISQSCAGPRATQQPRNEIWANRQGAVSEIELSNLDRARPRINKHHRHANYQPYRSNDPGSICEYILLKHETHGC